MKSTVSSFAKRHDCSLCNTIKALDNLFFFPRDKNREFKEQMGIRGHFSNPTPPSPLQFPWVCYFILNGGISALHLYVFPL